MAKQSWLFKFLRVKTGDPVHKAASMRIKRDANGNIIYEPISATTHTIAPDGSLNEVIITPDRFYDCGCNANLRPIGGKCHDGGCTSCIQCHGICSKCQKPICPEHSTFTEISMGMGKDPQRVRLCNRCHGKLFRWSATRSIASAIFSPFIIYEDEQ